MGPIRRTLELPWGTISYLEWSPTSAAVGPDVVLLHGGGLDNAWLSWGGLGAALAEQGYRVVAPDHPGSGQSPPAAWTATQERLVDYVGDVVDALGLRHYAIGGLSLGGGMTLGHLLERPGAAAGAMLLGSYGLMDHQFTGPIKVPAHVLTWLMLRTGALDAVMRAYGKDRRRMESSVRNIIRNPEGRTPELLDAIMAEAQRGAGLVPFSQWQRDQFLWNRLRSNYTDRLHAIEVPALVIHGDHDSGVPVAYARIAAERLPDARLLVVPDAGHWVQRDRPEVVTPAVVAFLDGLR